MVSVRDLVEERFGGNAFAARKAIDALKREGKLEEHAVMVKSGKSFKVLTATGQGRREARERTANSRQRYWAGAVKPGEQRHDAAVYRAARTEIAALEKDGCRIKRIELDYEMKGRVARASERARAKDGKEAAQKAKRAEAEKIGLPVDKKGHVSYPDARIEYENEQGESGRVSIEVTSDGYRSKDIQAKAAAGFALYANGRAAMNKTRVGAPPRRIETRRRQWRPQGRRAVLSYGRFPHLDGRVEALAEELDLPADTAEWLAVAALHSGCFLRTQLPFYSNQDRKAVARFTRKLIEQNLIVEMPVDELGLLYRITSKRVYRALGADNIRHRRLASWPIMYRRLLALDYVLDHPELPWLPTEAEKKWLAFEALAIPRNELPSRVWRGTIGKTKRYFANKHPIAVDSHAQAALFVYVDSDEQSTQGLQSWRDEHAALWSRLYDLGFGLSIVHASRNPKTLRESRQSIRELGCGPCCGCERQRGRGGAEAAPGGAVEGR